MLMIRVGCIVVNINKPVLTKQVIEWILSLPFSLSLYLSISKSLCLIYRNNDP